LRDFACRIEDLGFSTWLMPDHFGPQMAPGPAMVFVASVTSTLRVGTFVYDNDFRHPALLAKEIATVDALTDGRLEVGLGAGWNPADYERTGIPFDPPKSRVDRFEETLQIIDAYLTQDEVTHTGTVFQVRELPSGPKPVQTRIPVMIGASGRRMLRIAARRADIISLQTVGGVDAHADHLAGVNRKLAELREFAGPRFDDIELNISLDVVEHTDDVAGAAERFAVKRNLSREGALASPWALFGSTEAMAQQLVARREEFGISYPVIMARDLDAFAPVVQRLAGT
jgi:probable F420-dependent oxidoreductase